MRDVRARDGVRDAPSVVRPRDPAPRTRPPCFERVDAVRCALANFFASRPRRVAPSVPPPAAPAHPLSHRARAPTRVNDARHRVVLARARRARRGVRARVPNPTAARAPARRRRFEIVARRRRVSSIPAKTRPDPPAARAPRGRPGGLRRRLRRGDVGGARGGGRERGRRERHDAARERLVRARVGQRPRRAGGAGVQSTQRRARARRRRARRRRHLGVRPHGADRPRGEEAEREGRRDVPEDWALRRVRRRVVSPHSPPSKNPSQIFPSPVVFAFRRNPSPEQNRSRLVRPTTDDALSKPTESFHFTPRPQGA